MKKFFATSLLTLFFATSNLIAQGSLWGLTFGGGQDGLGVLFKTNLDGTGQTIVKEFTTEFKGAAPWYSKLCLATLTTGKLYGLTQGGGSGGVGVLYEFDPVTGNYIDKVNFIGLNGKYPHGSLVQAATGKLYGMTSEGGLNGLGVIFEYDPATSIFVKIQDLNGVVDGGKPFGSLVTASDSKLYGMTSEGGTNNKGVIFQIDPTTNAFEKKLDFAGNDGQAPFGNLIQAPNGKLYGMTQQGGTNGMGVLFEYDIVSTTAISKIDFDGSLKGSLPFGNSLFLASNNKLYGMTYQGGVLDSGVLFEFDPLTNVYVKRLDFNGSNGSYPQGDLIEATNGKFYGLTSRGGANDNGVLFEYDSDSDFYSKKIDFNKLNGANPFGSLIQLSNNRFYGLTANGGIGLGVLFEYELSTNSVVKKVEFSSTIDGSLPGGSLLQASNGNFYGLCSQGGSNGFGTLFEYSPATNFFSKKHNFTSSRNPVGTLIQVPSGELYGTANNGGAFDLGVIFKYDVSNNVLTTLMDFDGLNNGSYPQDLVIGPNGRVYGMCTNGGSNNMGVLFELDPITNNFTKKLDFDEISGGQPQGGLTLASNGKFYGSTTSGGGSYGQGTLFEFNSDLNAYSKKVELNSIIGNYINGSLIEAPNGNLYGLTASGGSFFGGVLFEYNFITNIFTKKIEFDGPNLGIGPLGTLTSSSNGKLYGMTARGGLNNLGVLFEFDPSTNNFFKRLDFNGINGANPIRTKLLIEAQRQNQAITFSSLPSKVFGDPSFTLSATSTSSLPISYTSSNTSAATVIGNNVTIVGVGTTIITASQEGDINYNPAADVPQTLTVNKGSQIITFISLPIKTFGDASFTLSATSSSNLSVSYASSNTSVATVSGNTVTLVGGGTTTITASQAGNANYNAATDVPQTLTVNKANQTITFTALSAKNFGDPSFTLATTSSSNLAVNYASSNTSVATVSGNTVIIVGGGTTTITASQAGNANYNAATDVPQTLTVNKANQTITFALLPAKTFGDAPFTLTATASSSLPITFATTTTKISINGNQATLVSAGQATLRATQAGNASFNSAADVSQTFCINPAKPVISAIDLLTESPSLSSSATAGNQWYKDGAAISNATNASVKVNASGSYSVESTIEACKSVRSSDFPIIVTGDITSSNTTLEISPNPAGSFLRIVLPGDGQKEVRIIQLTGAILEHQITDKKEISIDIRNYSANLYLVQVTSAGRLYHGKFVKE